MSMPLNNSRLSSMFLSPLLIAKIDQNIRRIVQGFSRAAMAWASRCRGHDIAPLRGKCDIADLDIAMFKLSETNKARRGFPATTQNMIDDRSSCGSVQNNHRSGECAGHIV